MNEPSVCSSNLYFYTLRVCMCVINVVPCRGCCADKLVLSSLKRPNSPSSLGACPFPTGHIGRKFDKKDLFCVYKIAFTSERDLNPSCPLSLLSSPLPPSFLPFSSFFSSLSVSVSVPVSKTDLSQKNEDLYPRSIIHFSLAQRHIFAGRVFILSSSWSKASNVTLLSETKVKKFI